MWGLTIIVLVVLIYGSIAIGAWPLAVLFMLIAGVVACWPAREGDV